MYRAVEGHQRSVFARAIEQSEERSAGNRVGEGGREREIESERAKRGNQATLIGRSSHKYLCCQRASKTLAFNFAI